MASVATAIASAPSIADAPRNVYVPTFQGLSPVDLLKPARSRATCYPFDAPHVLSFYRARNAIYYLFEALRASDAVAQARERARAIRTDAARDTESPREAGRPLTVLMPDYNSGNEVAAIEATGATIRYYTVDRRMQADPQEVERLCGLHKPDVLYVIHYLGWPQPMPALVDLCRRRNILVVEDCALALLSGIDGQALGTFGDWSIYCLYKTLPVPNGALLVQNTTRLEALEHLPLREVSFASVLGRTAELMVQRLRSRANSVGAALQAVKRSMGRAAGAMEVNRAKVGDIGFNLGDVDLRMSSVSARLLQRFDFERIRRRRVENYRQLSAALDGHVTQVWPDGPDGLPEGVCPLFMPILVPDKRAAADTLRQHGIDVLEFWNHGVPSCDSQASDVAHSLRAHVLGLPVHQDVLPRHIAHMADLVPRLHLKRA